MSRLYTPQHRQQRWMAAKNVSRQTIPGFALVMLAPWEAEGGPPFVCQESRDGQVVWHVDQPNDACEARQDPGQLAVNGPRAIPAGGYGLVTQDWPTQVLHDGGQDWLPNARPCGPRAGQWEVWLGGTALVCLSHDATSPIPGKYHTVWVARGGGQGGSAFAQAEGSGFSVAPGQAVTLSAPMKNGVEPTQDSKGLALPGAGLYQAGFSAQLGSATAARGATLRLRVMQSAGAFDAATGTTLLASRLMDIERIYIGQGGGSNDYQDVLRTAENVSCTGLLNLAEAMALWLVNDCNSSVAVANARLWVLRIGPYYESPGARTASGGYGP